MLPFHQIDVFASRLGEGNPLAVVHDADGLSAEEMAEFARWTNLSETAFLLEPTDPRADYRVRIFTPGGELPFAGHPTLGSARAWAESTGAAAGSTLVQECGAGLVRLRADGSHFAFDAPDLERFELIDAVTRERIETVLGLPAGTVDRAALIDNGPGWIGVLLADARTVLDLEPDYAAFEGLRLGVLGRHQPGGPADYETRAFIPDIGVREDPVTGSLAAGFARWLIPEGLAPSEYTVHQGARLGRHGLIEVLRDADGFWVGGDTVVGVRGTVALD